LQILRAHAAIEGWPRTFSIMKGASMRYGLYVSFLVLVCSPILCKAADRQPLFSGQWEGDVQIPGSEVRLVIDLAPANPNSASQGPDAQAWIGSLTAPQFGLKGAPLVAVTVKQNEIEFALKGGATFKAHLDADGTLRGQYTQGGNSAPFQFKRVGDPHVELPEPSTPISKDLQGDWRGSFQFQNSTYNVTFELPDGGTANAPAGELVVKEWANAKVPIVLWKQDGNRIFVMFGDGQLSYDGVFHRDSSEIAGSFRNHFLEFPMTLHRETTGKSSPQPPAEQPAGNGRTQ
jgi:hypothetical protein